MRLQLTRPIVFFDLESTGTDAQNDRIVEMAFFKMLPDGTVRDLHHFVNPQRPIPANASAVHGITDAAVSDKPTFADLAYDVLIFIKDCDLGGYNCLMYDLPMLVAEFERAQTLWDHSQCHIVDAGNLFKIMEERTLSAAVRFYCGREMEGAHGALADTLATADVLIGQLDRYDGLPVTIPELALKSNYGKRRADSSGKFTINDDGEYVINFGQNKGQLAKDNRSFLIWMLSKNFPADALAICTEILYPKSKAVAVATTDSEDLPF